MPANDIQAKRKAAMQMGFTQQEIEEYERMRGIQPQEPEQPAGENPLLSFAKGIAQPFVDSTKRLGGAVYEAGAAGLDAAGVPNVYIKEDGSMRENPLAKWGLGLSNKELEGYTPDQFGDRVFDAVKDSAEIASYFVPGGKGVKAAATAGAKAGALQGFSNAETVKDIPGSVAMGTGLGAAGGAGAAWLQGKFGQYLASHKGKPQKLIHELFRPAASEVDELKRFGKMNMADEVVARDLPKLKSKSFAQINDYYQQKSQEMIGKVDDYLTTMQQPVDTQEVLSLKDEVIASLKTPGNTRQGRAMQLLDDYTMDIESLGPETDLVTLNNFKRQLQDDAAGFYNAENPTKESQAIAEFARKVQHLIEKKAPGVKDLNRTTQFYTTMAKVAGKRFNTIQNSESGLMNTLLATGAVGGAGMSAFTGNPLFALMGIGPTAFQYVSRSPGVKVNRAIRADKLANKAFSPNETLNKLVSLAMSRYNGGSHEQPQ